MSKNKTPSLYPTELVWETPFGTITLWAKKYVIPSDVYTLPWEADGLAVRSDDVIFPGMENMYNQYWDMIYVWANSESVLAPIVMRDIRDQLAQISRKAGMQVPKHRFTVVPLKWLGHMAKVVKRNMRTLRFGGPSGKLADTERIYKAISSWASCFSTPMITVKRRNQEQELADKATADMNTSIVLPERNITDMLMAPYERKRFSIQGAGVFHFFFTFRAERPKLYALCTLLNPTLHSQHAHLMLPDVWTGGHGNSLMLTVEVPFLCDGFPLIHDGEYPNAASHDMTYEAVRKAEKLAQSVYDGLAEKLESYDAEESGNRTIQAALEG